MIIPPAQRLSHVGEYYFSCKLEVIRQMRLQGKDVINLGIGSPDLAPSGATLEAAARALAQPESHAYASYRSTPELRGAMADFYARVYGVTLNPATEVLPLLGSKEGILYASMAFLNPGDGVLVPNPGYPAYRSVAALLGAQVFEYDLEESSNWMPNLAALERLPLDLVRMMWVNYPHMPTGTPADPAVFSALVDFGMKHRILICHDNPYSMVLNRSTPRSLLSADPQRLVTLELNSLSKSFNMAGWRVGMVASSQGVIDSILQVKSNVDSGMFLPVQAGAVAALGNPDAWHQDRNATYEQRRNVVWQMFERLGFHCDRRQEGMFVWARAPANVGAVDTFLDGLLEQALVFITPGLVFGSNGRRYARASLCTPRARLEEAIERIEGWRS